MVAKRVAAVLPVTLAAAVLWAAPAAAHTGWCSAGSDRHAVAGYTVTRVRSELVWHGATGRWRWRQLNRIDAAWWSVYGDGRFGVWCS